MLANWDFSGGFMFLLGRLFGMSGLFGKLALSQLVFSCFLFESPNSLLLLGLQSGHFEHLPQLFLFLFFLPPPRLLG